LELERKFIAQGIKGRICQQRLARGVGLEKGG
jgi:hypothetical protein